MSEVEHTADAKVADGIVWNEVNWTSRQSRAAKSTTGTKPIMSSSCRSPGFLGSSLYRRYSQASWNSCWGKKKPAMKNGCGLQNDMLRSLISFMLGEESMPYCWAAKSNRKEAGA